MMIADQDFPLILRSVMTSRLVRTTGAHHSASACPTVYECTGVGRIGQDRQDSLVAGNLPRDLRSASAATDARQGNPFLNLPQGGLSHAAHLAKLAEYAVDRLLDLTVGRHFDSVILRSYISRRHVP